MHRYAPAIGSAATVLAVQIGLYCLFPFALALRPSGQRVVLFTVYVSALMVFGGLLGAVYSLELTDGLSVSGGAVAYAATVMSILLLFVLERDVAVVRSMLIVVALVNIFKFLVFLTVDAALETDGVMDPFGVADELFSVSARVVVVGGTLLAIELLAVVVVLETVRRRVPDRMLPVALGVVFVAVLAFDGLAFPVLALPFGESLDAIEAGVGGKLLLAAGYAVPVTIFLLVYRPVLRAFRTTPVRVTDVFVGRARLVDELARQRQALAESTGRYRHLAESIGDVFVALDADLRCTYCNSGAADLLECTPTEAVGRSLDQLLPHEAGSALDRFLRTAHSQRRADRYVGRLRSDALQRWWEFTVYPSDDGLSLFGRDVTDRERSREALELQSAALNAAANAMLITDDLGVVIWANSEFCLVSGYDSDELIGMDTAELLMSEPQSEGFYDQVLETILAGRTWRGEISTRRKSGELAEIELTITPVVSAGRGVTHFVAAARDLTERNHLQAQVLQAQKMETVGRLAGGIAHDFNNLLTVINGMAEVAMLRVPADDPVVGDLRQIQLAGERATALTRQLLDFSRRRITSPELVDVAAVVDDLRPILRRVLGDDIALDVEHHGPACVRADRGQIEQVVMNLVVNANDALDGPGNVRITTDVVDHRPDRRWSGTGPAGPQVVLTVSDDGCGMDAMAAARAFEPFFTTKDSGKGTGLGLATVYGIVQHSGGSIDVQTRPDEGTTFTILLPHVPLAPVAAEPDTDTDHASHAGTILVVEDEDAVRQLITEVLVGAGYDVVGVADAEAALDTLDERATTVDLLLTDVVLPGMSGVALAERVTAASPDLRVLFTSGYTDDETLRRGVRNSAVRFIGKPFTVTDLRRAVRDALDDR